MSPLLLFDIILFYFSLLMVISWFASRHIHDSTYFDGDRASIINTIFKIAGYTYGPILGLYLTGLFSKIGFKERFVPAALYRKSYGPRIGYKPH